MRQPLPLIKWFLFIPLALLLGCGRPATNSSGVDQAPRDFGAPPSSGTVDYGSCASRTLHVEFNARDPQFEEGVTQSSRALARYPNLSYVAVPRQEGRAIYQIYLLNECTDEACATQQGWRALQADLTRVPGVTVSCEKAPEPRENDRSPKQDQRKQDQPKQDQPKQEQPKQDTQQGSAPGMGGGNQPQ